MTNRKTTGALVSSVIALILCCAMLVGSTFAWFTDSASTAVNTIQSGTLKVDLVDAQGNSLDGESLSFMDKNGNADILWEPNCTFKTQQFKVVNDGNLALQYEIVINGVNGDAALLNAIEFWLEDEDGAKVALNTAVKLEAEGASKLMTLVGHMKAEAGNEYQGKTLSGLGISVYATQVPHESDSVGPNYDDLSVTAVSTPEEFAAAFDKGGVVVLTEDVKLNDVVLTPKAGETTVIDLNGKTLSGVSTSSTASTMIKVPENATLVLENGTVTFGATTPDTNWGGEGQPAFPGYANNTINCQGKLIINGATVENKTAAGGASYAIDCYPGADVVINDGTVNGYGKNAIRTFANSATKPINVTINGGTVQGTRAVWVQLPSSNPDVAPVVNLTVNGGTLVSTDTADTGYYLAIYSYAYGNSANGVTIALNGGEVFGNVAVGGGSKVGRETVTVDAACKLYGDVYRYLANDATEDIAVSNAKGGVATDSTSLNATLNAVKTEQNATVYVVAGDYTSFPASSVGAGTTVVCEEGTVFEGKSGLNINGGTVVGATFDAGTGDTSASGTINGNFKDCTFTGGAEGVRWCYTTAGKTVVFENCVFEATLRGIHFDSMDGDVIFRNCVINGFNAYGGTGTATFENCTFGNDQSRYNGLNIYANTVLKDCTFNYISGKTNFIDMEANGKTLTIINCTATLDGVAADVTDFVGGSKLGGCTVTVDGASWTPAP